MVGHACNLSIGKWRESGVQWQSPQLIVSSRQPRQLDCLQTNKANKKAIEKGFSVPQNYQTQSPSPKRKNRGHPYLSRRKQKGNHMQISTESYTFNSSLEMSGTEPQTLACSCPLELDILFWRVRNSRLLSGVHSWNI